MGTNGDFPFLNSVCIYITSWKKIFIRVRLNIIKPHGHYIPNIAKLFCIELSCRRVAGNNLVVHSDKDYRFIKVLDYRKRNFAENISDSFIVGVFQWLLLPDFLLGCRFLENQYTDKLLIIENSFGSLNYLSAFRH